MPLVTWSEALAIDVESIDDQHKQLIDLLNQIYQAVTGSASSEVMAAGVTALIEHSRMHFADEERVMEDMAYPACDIHKAEHELLMARVLEMPRQLLSGQAPMTIDALLFLKDWLVDHMQSQDMLLGVYVHAQHAD